MSSYSLCLLMIVATGQGQGQAPDTPEARARRAALVDRIMAEPSAPDALPQRRVADVPQPPVEVVAPQVRQEVIRIQTNRRRSLTLETPAADAQAIEDGEEIIQPRVPFRLDLQTAVLGRENFDRWVFGEKLDEEGRRLKLKRLLADKLNSVMQERHLNATQLQKLRVAGNGDISRFLDRVEERRLDFEVARKSFNAGSMFLRDLDPLAAEFENGPFGFDSLFAKVLNKIDNDSKAEK